MSLSRPAPAAPAPETPPAAPPRPTRLRLVARHALAPEVVEVRLRPAPGEAPIWRAGQYLDLLPPDGRPRSFSIANPPPGAASAPVVPGVGGPVVPGDLVLHVRLGAAGSYSRVLAALDEGTVLDAVVARGAFGVPADGPGRGLWLAGGTGLAPLMAMLATCLPETAPETPQRLFWGAREEADLYAAPTLDAWAARFPAFAWTPVLSAPPATWAGARGLVHEVLLAAHDDLRAHDVYASGPPAMIEAARELFLPAGLSEERLHYDRFEPGPAVAGAVGV